MPCPLSMRDAMEPCHSERWWVSDQISNLLSYKSKNSKKHVLFSCYITIYYEYYKLENPNMSWLNFRGSFLSKVDIFQSIIPTGYRGPKLRKFGPIGGFEDVFLNLGLLPLRSDFLFFCTQINSLFQQKGNMILQVLYTKICDGRRNMSFSCYHFLQKKA